MTKTKIKKFSLIELLICITIVAILTGIFISVGDPRKAEKDSTLTLIKRIEKALYKYHIRHKGNLPDPIFLNASSDSSLNWLNDTLPVIDLDLIQAYGDFSKADFDYSIMIGGARVPFDHISHDDGNIRPIRYLPIGSYNAGESQADNSRLNDLFQISSCGIDGKYGYYYHKENKGIGNYIYSGDSRRDDAEDDITN